MSQTPTGTKPLNASVMDGGASWKDRYKVADDLANKIEYCVTFAQGDMEFCFIVSLNVVNPINDLVPSKENFPIGSVFIFKSSNNNYYEYIKSAFNTWEVVSTDFS